MVIKVQSISDLITNSSTEVFTIYKRYNIQDIKDLVNALFKLISNLRFDDFFTITLYINEYVIDDLYDSYEELMESLNEYVGEDGKFTPIVKSVSIFVDKEEF